jgi:small conductance mechanosensitive channel
VKVKDGVVFLTGRTALDANKQWAGDLARNTEDVVAVVNHLEVVHGAIWDFSPAFDSLKQMEINLVRSLPLIASGLLILALAYAAAIITTRWTRRGLEHRVYAPLLREVFARCAGFLVLIIGLYMTLRIANLTHLALTIMGGTGLLGLVLGIAFGNITENFLASILLSMQQPFRVGDLVKIEDTLGYVQRLTTRTTVIATVDGNEVQIPNATIYKSVIRNFSTMPNSRVDFTLSVPRAQVEEVQQAAIKVIAEHPLVLAEPEPSVLVDSATNSTASLKAYFWINGRDNSWLKVRSSVMRLVLHAIDQAEGNPRHSDSASESRGHTNGKKQAARRSSHEQTDSSSTAVATKAEGTLVAEAESIKEQAQEARPTDGENLLSPKTDAAAPPPGES